MQAFRVEYMDTVQADKPSCRKTYVLEVQDTQTNRHAGIHTYWKYMIRRQTVMQAYIRTGSTGHADKPSCRHTYVPEVQVSAYTLSCRQTDLPEGQDVYMQINNNQPCTQTELPEVHYVYMKTIAVLADTRTGSIQFALMHTIRADKQHNR
jgi:hypothetical protein